MLEDAVGKVKPVLSLPTESYLLELCVIHKPLSWIHMQWSEVAKTNQACYLNVLELNLSIWLFNQIYLNNLF